MIFKVLGKPFLSGDYSLRTCKFYNIIHQQTIAFTIFMLMLSAFVSKAFLSFISK